MYLQINHHMFLGICILRMGRRCSSCSSCVSKNRRNRRIYFPVQIQRCIIWKMSSLDEIRYDYKLKKEEREENIDDNEDKQEI